MHGSPSEPVQDSEHVASPSASDVEGGDGGANGGVKKQNVPSLATSKDGIINDIIYISYTLISLCN